MCLFLCLEKAVSHSGCLRGVADELVEEIDLLRGERQFWRGFGEGSVEHRDPEDPPAEQAQDREQVDDSFGSSESVLLGLADRCQYLVEGLDLPAQALPAELLDGLFAAAYGQVRDELPVDPVPVLGICGLGGVDDGEFERGVQLLFGDWGKNLDTQIANLDNGFASFSPLVPHINAMQPSNSHLSHLVGDGVISVSGKMVDAGPQEKMGAGIVGRTEQFVDVALAIADMHDALRLCEKCVGLLHVLQPAIALLLLDRHARWVDRALQRVRAVELVPGPELDSGQSKRKPLLCHDHAAAHQHSTHRVITATALRSCALLAHHADRLVLFATIDELRRVVEHQHRPTPTGREPLSRTYKLPTQHLLLP